MDKAGQIIKKLPPVEHTIIYMVVIYIIGTIGMLVPEVRSIFMFLTPVNILLATTVAFLYHTGINKKFIAACIIVYLGGYLIELLGIKTGLIFGQYEYGEGLGVKLWGVPIVMGINWLLLIYGVSCITHKYLRSPIWNATAGAALMVIYDVFLEPSAIKYGFWIWNKGYIPLQNYLAWFITAFVFILIFNKLTTKKSQNPVGSAIFWLQLIFFACLLIGNNLQN